MGRIGEVVAKRARLGFEMNVVYHNRSRKPEAEQKWNLTYCTLEQLLNVSDFVVMLAPSNAETYHMMGEQQFAAMKQNAIFINVSRGQTVDEAALVKALIEDDLCCGVKCIRREPIAPDHPLLKLDNVITLPHSAFRHITDAF